MLTPEILNYILGFIALMSIAFNIWSKVRKPQEDIEKKQAVSDKEIESKATILLAKEVEAKADILAKQVQWTSESNEKRFSEMQLNIRESTALAQNHIHTIQEKVEGLVAMIYNLDNKIATLTAIIQERIPKK